MRNLNFSLLLLAGMVTPAAAQSLKNGGFEAPYQPVTPPTSTLAKIDGNVAGGWRDESGWGEVSIGYAQDVDQKHGGTAAQRIDVRSVGKGGVQFVQELPFRAGRTYRFTAWARAAANSNATIMLRKSGAPYNTLALADVALTTAWQQVTVTGQATESDTGLVMFLPKATGSYWLDDAVLEDITDGGTTPAPASPAAAGAGPQLVKNAGLEAPYLPVTPPTSPLAKIDGNVAGGWRDESGWGEVSIGYAMDTDQKHGGAAAQRIEVRSIGKGSVQFVQEIPIRAGRTYRFTAFLKSAVPTTATIMLRKSGAPYNTLGIADVALTPLWQQVTVTGQATEDTAGLVMFLPKAPGTYWLDDVTLQDITDGDAAPAPATTLNTPIVAAPAGPAATVQAKNGGMEGQYVAVSPASSPLAHIEGQLAPGWRDDSGWGEVSIGYARDEVQAHSGVASQRIDLRSIGKGGPQFVQDQQLTAGRIYRVSAYLRSASTSHVFLQLRQRGAPYQIFGQVNAAVSAEWHYFEVFARVTQTCDGMILVGPSEPNSYWIDDVKFEDVTDTLATTSAAHAGNLWADGSFETGLSNGWHMRVAAFDIYSKWAGREQTDVQPRSDESTAMVGEKSVAITLGPWTGGLLGSPLTPVAFGRTYTASIALRADQPTSVGLSLDGTTSNTNVDVGPNWQRFSISGTMLLGTTTRLHVRCIVRDTDKPVTFWLDGAMLEEGDNASPKYLAAYPVELGLSVPRPGSIVFDGENAPINTQIGSGLDAAVPAKSQLKWSLEGLDGKLGAAHLVPLPLKTLNLGPDAKGPRGLFKVHAQVVDGAGQPLSPEVEKVFARLPKPRTLTVAQAEASYFGGHIELQPEKIAIAVATGTRWIRLHDASTTTLWPTVEPQPGQWNWNDGGIALARASGLNVLGLLAGAPPRVSTKPQAQVGFFSNWNLPDAPGALDGWSNYASQTVAHYKPLINHWEIWNEPYINSPENAFFPSGTPEQYAELLLRASKAVRASDPKATIIGVCSPGNANEWLERVLKVAGPANFDVMSFHGYYNRLQGGPTPQVMPLMTDLRAMQTRFGTAKPLWNSEGSPGDNLSWYVDNAAAVRGEMTSLVRLDVVQMANGVGKFFPYTLHGDADEGEGNLNMLEYDRALKPGIAARAVLASLVDGAAFTGRTELAPGVDCYAFKQPGGATVQAVWSYDAKSHSVAVPTGASALDISGNPLAGAAVAVTDEPIYFVKK